MTCKCCSGWTRLFALLAVSGLTLLAFNTAVVAAFSGPRATVASSAPPRSLILASEHSKRADRVLVSSANTLKSCRRANSARPARCKLDRRAVQHAGTVLASAERHLASIARATGRGAGGDMAGASRFLAARRAPALAVSGYTLKWGRVDSLNSYLLERKVPGRATRYSVIRGTSITPPPVPGVVVRYSIRTTAYLSAWAHEQPISYPAPARTVSASATIAPTPTLAPVTTDTQAAPAITVSGTTLMWDPIANVSAYILATKAPAKPIEYTVVSGTSVTPQSVPGTTIGYSVRTAVDGSAWGTEVAISYPAESISAPTEAPAPAAGSVIIGLVGGSGWGPAVAEKVIAVGFKSERFEADNIWTAEQDRVSYDDGFRNDQVIVGNTPDETKLSTINTASWVAKALEEVKEAVAYNYTLLEVGNEMYLKGGQAEPVKYAEMYMALDDAIKAAGITGVTLIFNSFGDYQKANGETSEDSSGGGWLGDALSAQPALKEDVQAFSAHPYDIPGVKYDGHDWGIEGLEQEHSYAVALGFDHTDYYATEYGEEDQSPQAPANAQVQAERIKWAYTELLSQPYVKGIWYYQLHDDGTGHWGLVSGTWEPRPALAVVEGFLHGSL